MDKQGLIQSFILGNREKFPDYKIPEIEAMLNRVPEDKIFYFSALELKDPTMMLIIALVGGSMGIDRFLLGDTTNGILKLILNLCLVGFIWVIIDIFTANQRTKDFNFKKFEEAYRLNAPITF